MKKLYLSNIENNTCIYVWNLFRWIKQTGDISCSTRKIDFRFPSIHVYNIYIDASVLLEQWHIFHILTIVKILRRHFPFLYWIYIIKRKLHGGLKIWILSSRDENNILLIRYTLIRKILFSSCMHSKIKPIFSRHRVTSSYIYIVLFII